MTPRREEQTSTAERVAHPVAGQATDHGGDHSGDTTGLADRLAAQFIAFRAGDSSALADLVRCVTPVLWHIARSFRLDAATAEDVVQNALLTLVRRGDSITEPRAVLRWLAVTTRREALQALRYRARTEMREDPLDGAPAPAAEQPERQTMADDAARVLWRNVAQLPQRCQQLLRVVAFVERPDYQEVSAALGMPVGSIGPTRGRCLAKLRNLLARDPEWAS